jgi:hypothetical protein
MPSEAAYVITAAFTRQTEGVFMRLPDKAVAWALATALPLALCIASPLHAASSQDDDTDRAVPCDHALRVDPSLQVCATALGSTLHYRLEAVDGTRAELTLSEGGVTLQQSGPDSVRVVLGTRADTANHAMPSSIVRTVYRDAIVSIGEVQDGWQPPRWRIDLNMRPAIPPTKKTCTRDGCSGSIQQYSDMQPTQKTCTRDGCSGHIQQYMDMSPTMQPTQ